MKRIFDLIFASVFGLLILLPFLFICLVVKFTSKGPVFYWSNRIGVKNLPFKMPKFRTMHQGTPTVATHLLHNPQIYLTPIGSFLRKSSLDELPQLWSIFKGDMSFVGPRPALFNQKDLIALRSKAGIDTLVPGLTGWAQVNGRDNLSIRKKVALDIEYMENQSIYLDLKIIWVTFWKTAQRKGISH
jgi:O-antigen biosynthesis protein WbqP